MEINNLPIKDGWYWILLDGYEQPIPCWYMSDSKCFLPAGLGDASSVGIYAEDIIKVGPEINVPIF